MGKSLLELSVNISPNFHSSETLSTLLRECVPQAKTAKSQSVRRLIKRFKLSL